MKIVKRLFLVLTLIVIVAVGAGVWILYGSKTSNPNNYQVVGDIPAPWGYERINGDDASYGHLYQTGQYGRIRFQNVNGKAMAYGGGGSRKAFEQYLRNLYGVASTFSLSREMKTRRLADMQPGDVFVYPARYGQKYGHAVMVVDVAQNALLSGGIAGFSRKLNM